MAVPTLPVEPIPSKDPKKKKEEEEKQDKPDESTSKDKADSNKDGKAADKKDGDEDEMSEEDAALLSNLNMLAERLSETDTSLHRPALEQLRVLIKTSTSSMTSVPKPLKFLRPRYKELQALWEKWGSGEDKALFATILSVLAMTYSDTEPRGTLKYRLLSQTYSKADSEDSDPGQWGHEYVRHLASELGEEYNLLISPPDAEEVKPPPPPPPAATSTSEKKDEKEEQAEEPTIDLKLANTPISPSHLSLEQNIQALRELAVLCSKFFLAHNAEPDAVDLLEELEMIERLEELVKDKDWDVGGRCCSYMIGCVNFLPPPDDALFLRTAHLIYMSHRKFPEALALAIRLSDRKLVWDDFNAVGNPLMKKQLSYILSRAQVPMSWVTVPPSSSASGDDIMDQDDEPEPLELEESLAECLTNANLSTHFRTFGKELGVEDAKSLEDIYKSHLEGGRGAAQPDSARANLAGTFVNAFVNGGYGNDKLMVGAAEGESWVYKNKEHGMLSASASLGLLLLWDTDIGLSHVDKYTYSNEEFIKAGALLATGMLNCGIRTEADAAKALLEEYVENKSVVLKVMSIVGLGIAYTQTHRNDLLALLLPILADTDSNNMEILSMASLALGFIFVGSCNGDVAGTILQCIMEKVDAEDKALGEKWGSFLALGLALLYVGRQDASDATIETLKAIPHPLSKQAQVLVEVCSYAGTSNVLKVQQMLHECTDHVVTKKDKEKDKEKGKEDEKKEGEGEGEAKPEGEKKEGEGENADDAKKPEEDDKYQAFAVLGIALVAMGEDVGAEMALRTFNHLMHYGEPTIRKMVPLAIGLISVSNPQLPIMDTLSKYSHDNDLSVALNAIFAMGLIGAGTNNARLAQMLRQLAGYYHKEADCLFMVRIAQGLVHMGKGTIGLNPFFLDRNVMNKSAVCGLMATLVAMSDAQGFILDKSHWMLYFLVTAIFPRFMITLDENLEAKPVTVRVGQAVDVIGQAGKPRKISGFQTHQTPVRLGTTDRAELATEEFIPFANVLEGFVILQKNPGWEKEDQMEL